MSSDINNPHAAVEAAAKLVQILLPLTPDERKRAIAASMLLLGQPMDEAVQKPTQQRSLEDLPPSSEGISPKAFGWMRKNGITREQLDHVFSIEQDSIEVIAAKMPGDSKRQQTVEAYVICGLKAFLQTGEPTFGDKDARVICSKVGCYDIGNHSNYVNALGNLASGSREIGWKLSNPGLVRAADIVKTLAPTTSS